MRALQTSFGTGSSNLILIHELHPGWADFVGFTRLAWTKMLDAVAVLGAGNIGLLQRRQLDLESVITTRVRLAQAPEAIRDLNERRGEMIKILIDPRGGEA